MGNLLGEREIERKYLGIHGGGGEKKEIGLGPPLGEKYRTG